MVKYDYAELNARVEYVMYSVFAIPGGVLPEDREKIVTDCQDFFTDSGLFSTEREKASDDDRVVVRGFYDLSGFSAHADVLIWWHATSSDNLQKSYQGFRKTTLGRLMKPVWSVVGMHRPAEFNKSHVPAFMKGEEPGEYVCVYPFVRTYEWYLLPEEERRSSLQEHGMMAREYQQVRANTVASFALGDYEWLLAFEAPQPYDLLDLMHHLRYSQARLHVREETPFFTGKRRTLAEIILSLP